MHEVTTVKLNELVPDDYNARKHDRRNIKEIARSLGDFGQHRPFVVQAGTNKILVGNGMYQAMKKLKMQDALVIYVHDDDATALRRALADNRAGDLSDWNWAILTDIMNDLGGVNANIPGWSEDELSELMEQSFPVKEDEDELSPVEQTEITSISMDTEQYVKDCDRILMQFSGGKDSTLALNWAKQMSLKYDKPIEAIFVETGAEFPDVMAHVIKICEQQEIPLKLLNSAINIVQYLNDKREWPSPLHKPCIVRFIGKPVSEYALSFENENVIIIRGGRKNQRNFLSNSDTVQKITLNKKDLFLINPLFLVPEDEYQEILQSVKSLLWRGYSIGFLRTACWMCPFQQHQQWDMLKKYYPLLWEEMRIMTKFMQYPMVDRDNSGIRYNDYWENAQPLEFEEFVAPPPKI